MMGIQKICNFLFIMKNCFFYWQLHSKLVNSTNLIFFSYLFGDFFYKGKFTVHIQFTIFDLLKPIMTKVKKRHFVTLKLKFGKNGLEY